MLDEGPRRPVGGSTFQYEIQYSSAADKLISGNVIGNVRQMWGMRLWLFKLNITNCTHYTAHYIVHIAHYNLYMLHCTLHTVNVLCTLNCTMYTHHTLLAPLSKTLTQ